MNSRANWLDPSFYLELKRTLNFLNPFQGTFLNAPRRAFAVLCFVAIATGTTQAAVIQYTITVNVDTIGAPGSFGGNQWSFPSGPASFVGTFDADDSAIGAISNFSLTIGGLDLAMSLTGSSTVNSFDPFINYLGWSQYDALDSEYLTAFGGVWGGPSNYAVALENNDAAPLDPYQPYTQNWSGTYSIAPIVSVPDASSTLTLLVFALTAGVVARRRFIQR
jgi:hypothetical protein